MDWKNLQVMKCPQCPGKLEDHSLGYTCTKCEFVISYDRFKDIINKMMMPKKPQYDPDRVDRSSWQI